MVVSEWWSVIAVSLNVGGGVRLIKPAKLYICTQTHYRCVRPWFHTAEPLGERRYENWITHISQLSDNSIPSFISWKKGYRKDDFTVDCPHLIKKRLCKTRIVDFHWAKLAISEILLSYFQVVGDSVVSGRKFYYEKIIAIFLWYVCV